MGYRSAGTPRPGKHDYLLAFLAVIGIVLSVGICFMLVRLFFK